MTGEPRTLLAVGPESSLLVKVVPLLRRADLRVEQMQAGEDAMKALRERHFDLIVVQYPAAGLDLGGVVAAVRGTSSQCRSAGLMVVADREHAGDVSRFLGHGVNRIVESTSHVDRLLDGIADLLTVAPRRFLRSVVQLDVWVETGMKRVMSITENVSLSGMLVRGCREFDVGTRLFFELLLPGQERSVRGDMVIVRQTDRLREGIQGFGGRVMSFVGDGHDRLKEFLVHDEADDVYSEQPPDHGPRPPAL
jgi:DNA-binding NarL/FixJ family response regulator